MDLKKLGRGAATAFALVAGFGGWAWFETKTGPKEASVNISQDIIRAVEAGVISRECLYERVARAVDRVIDENRKTHIEISMQDGRPVYEVLAIDSVPQPLTCE